MGEYAKRKNDGQEVKIGTCENMYYIRFEDWGKIEYSYSWKDCIFRVPVPAEDHIKIGEYPSCFNNETILSRPVYDKSGIIASYEYYYGDECTLANPGTIQLRHESGLLVNVPCYHGQKLPDPGQDMKIFWNGKSAESFRLTGIKPTDQGIIFIISCRFCGKSFNCEFEEIQDYLQDDQILFERLQSYAAIFKAVADTEAAAAEIEAERIKALSRDPAALEIGRVLHLCGYNEPDYVIIADNGNYYECINLTEYTNSRQQKYGLSWPGEKMGIHVEITDRIKTAAEIEDIKQKVIQADLDREAAKKKQDREYKELEQVLIDEYAHLIRLDSDPKYKYRNYVVAAKNIRVELKRAFPGEKFSVRSESYSMGDSIHVSWKNPELDKQKIESIADKYQHGSFNGMEDIYESNHSAFTNLYGGSKYVFCQLDRY